MSKQLALEIFAGATVLYALLFWQLSQRAVKAMKARIAARARSENQTEGLSRWQALSPAQKKAVLRPARRGGPIEDPEFAARIVREAREGFVDDWKLSKLVMAMLTASAFVLGVVSDDRFLVGFGAIFFILNAALELRLLRFRRRLRRSVEVTRKLHDLP